MSMPRNELSQRGVPTQHLGHSDRERQRNQLYAVIVASHLLTLKRSVQPEMLYAESAQRKDIFKSCVALEKQWDQLTQVIRMTYSLEQYQLMQTQSVQQDHHG